MDDLISRQAAIDAMRRLEQEDIEAYGAKIPEGFDADPAVKALKALPSPQPERKTGRWVDYPIADGCLQCSVCGILRLGDASNFCPNCGARMNEVSKDE